MTARHRPTYSEINLNEVRHNYLQLKKCVAADAFFCPMVKANAYGHGAVDVTLALEAAGCEFVGVALVEEGIRLREGGVNCGVLVFGSFDSDDAEDLMRYRLTPVLCSWEQVEALDELAESPIHVHLEFNTGMNRLGFAVDEADKLCSWAAQHKNIKVDGICTHLAAGDTAGVKDSAASAQLGRFSQVVQKFAPLKVRPHVLNSAGMINIKRLSSEGTQTEPSELVTWGARPGLSLYGEKPEILGSEKLDLRPVMTIKSHLVALHSLEVGEGVSYDFKWRAARASVIGVLPIGYADGIARSLSNRGQVLYRGQRVPIVGTVCMDYLMIDLTEALKDQKNAHLGEEVVLLGQQGNEMILAREIAKITDTISYEVFTRVSERVPRVFVP